MAENPPKTPKRPRNLTAAAHQEALARSLQDPRMKSETPVTPGTPDVVNITNAVTPGGFNPRNLNGTGVNMGLRVGKVRDPITPIRLDRLFGPPGTLPTLPTSRIPPPIERKPRNPYPFIQRVINAEEEEEEEKKRKGGSRRHRKKSHKKHRKTRRRVRFDRI